jgi:alpha-L-fucosidase
MDDTKTKPYTADDFRFTTKDGHLYAMEMAWPETGHAVIHSIDTSMKVKAVTMLATQKPVQFSQQTDGLHLNLPTRPTGVHVYAYRIEWANG